MKRFYVRTGGELASLRHEDKFGSLDAGIWNLFVCLRHGRIFRCARVGKTIGGERDGVWRIVADLGVPAGAAAQTGMVGRGFDDGSFGGGVSFAGNGCDGTGRTVASGCRAECDFLSWIDHHRGDSVSRAG